MDTNYQSKKQDENRKLILKRIPYMKVEGITLQSKKLTDHM